MPEPEPTDPVKVYEDFFDSFWETVKISYYKVPQMAVTSEKGKDRIEFSNIDLLLDVSRSPIMTDSKGGGSLVVCVSISWDADPPTAPHSIETLYYEHPDLQVTKEGEYLYRFKGSLVHEQEGSYDHASMSIKLRRSLGTGTYQDNYMPIYPMPD